MKNWLTVLFAFTFINSVYCQSNIALPLPVHAKWVYYNYNSCFENYQIFDTVIVDGLAYNMGTYLFENCDGSIVNEGCFSPYNSIRSEGNIWYTLGGLNSVYFNWDSQEGDTIWYDGMLMGNYQLIVSNIDTITTIDNVQRRTYHFVYAFDGVTVPFDTGREIYMIEGIGCSVFGIDKVGIESQYFLLTCFYNEDDLLVYHQDYPLLNISGCCNVPESVPIIKLTTIQVFPSPAKEKVTIQFDGIHVPSSIQIFNYVGQVVHSEAVNGRQQMTLNTESLATGVYIVRAADSSLTATFIKE